MEDFSLSLQCSFRAKRIKKRFTHGIQVNQWYVPYPAGTFPGQAVELKDDTHFNAYEVYELADALWRASSKNHLAIEKFLLDIPAFDPAHPDSVGDFSLPLSPFIKNESNFGRKQ